MFAQQLNALFTLRGRCEHYPTIDSFNCYESCRLAVLAIYSSSGLNLRSKAPEKLAKFAQRCRQNIIAINHLFMVIFVYTTSHARTQTVEYDKFNTLVLPNVPFWSTFIQGATHVPRPPPADEIVGEHNIWSQKNASTQAKLVL